MKHLRKLKECRKQVRILTTHKNYESRDVRCKRIVRMGFDVLISLLGVVIAILSYQQTKLQKIAIEYENMPEFVIKVKHNLNYHIGSIPETNVYYNNGKETASTHTSRGWITSACEDSNEEYSIILSKGIAKDISIDTDEYVFITLKDSLNNADMFPSILEVIPIERWLYPDMENGSFVVNISHRPALSYFADRFQYMQRECYHNGQKHIVISNATSMTVYTISYLNCFGERISEKYYNPKERYCIMYPMKDENNEVVTLPSVREYTSILEPMVFDFAESGEYSYEYRPYENTDCLEIIQKWSEDVLDALITIYYSK